MLTQESYPEETRTLKLRDSRLRGVEMTIQIKIQFQHIDAGFAEKSKLTAFGVRNNQSIQFVFADSTRHRHPWDLKCCPGR